MNNVSFDTHKLYSNCINVTSGQENSSCNSEIQMLSGFNHRTMTSSNTQCHNIYHCETKKVDLHEYKINLNDNDLELHESNKLHEKKLTCIYRTRIQNCATH